MWMFLKFIYLPIQSNSCPLLKYVIICAFKRFLTITRRTTIRKWNNFIAHRFSSVWGNRTFPRQIHLQKKIHEKCAFLLQRYYLQQHLYICHFTLSQRYEVHPSWEAKWAFTGISAFFLGNSTSHSIALRRPPQHSEVTIVLHARNSVVTNRPDREHIH